MKSKSITRTCLIVMICLSFLACTEEEESPTEENTNTSYTITVGAFTLTNGVYTAVGNIDI